MGWGKSLRRIGKAVATGGFSEVENLSPGGLFGKPGESSSDPTEIPGIIGRPEAAGYLREAYGLLSGATPFGLDPATQELVNQAIAQSQGRFNALGIGASPGAQFNVAAAAAPTLADYRTKKIQELLQLAGFGVPQVGQTSRGTTAAQGIFAPIQLSAAFGGGGGVTG